MVSEEKFQIGDLVVLKSGGPVMSVNSVGADTATCKWFAGKKHETGVFNVATLRRATDDDLGKK